MHEQLNKALNLSARQKPRALIFAHQMYQLIRRILFLLPAETAHYFSMNIFKGVCSVPFLKKLLAKLFDTKTGSTRKVFKLSFKNVIGLGAGFDKNARYLDVLETLGFGFVEIGTITPRPQQGNDKPRLFRLPKDKALINRMGFNNEGVEIVADRLKLWREKKENESQGKSQTEISSGSHRPMLIGGNIGKNKNTPNEEAWKDYEICFKTLHQYVDYFVVNVSSPNTPGLRALQEKEALRKILVHLQMINNGKAVAKPILLKIAPDLTKEQIDDVVDLAMEIKLDGLVATNTTISRENLTTDSEDIGKQTGGLSGVPLKPKSTEIVQYISQKTNGKVPVIASGGVFTGIDAKQKLDAGASLVQVWTGFIYEGPFIVRNILKAL